MHRMKATWLAVVIVQSLFLPNCASAAVEFCNNFREHVYVTIAYEQHSLKDKGSWFVSTGWLDVTPGLCSYFDTALVVPELYFRIETDWYKDGRQRTKTSWPAQPDQNFWVMEHSFHFYSAEKGGTPPDREARWVGFEKSFTATDGDLTETVTVSADMKLSQSISVDAPDNKPSEAPKPGLDADGQKLVDAFRTHPPGPDWLSDLGLQFSAMTTENPPLHGQASVTQKLVSADATTSNDVNLFVFESDDAASKFVGVGDTTSPYAKDAPNGTIVFGHIDREELPTKRAFYLYHVDQDKNQLWVRCIATVGRAVVMTTTVEPRGNEPLTDQLPRDKIAPAFFPLLAGVEAMTHKPD
ncbi:DUF1036 domain-containing protein [Rhizobium sp. 2YAF20]|uniref:DUF1036 domain-containing protein n=1 Tax=Rhizobium sp. 2YAF20 TaxID=3233027 RepID=UPI003F9861AA